MVLLWISLFGRFDEPSIHDLDRMAQSRKVEDLSRLLDDNPQTGRNPFQIIRTNGAYEVGKFGWHCVSLNGVTGKKYVVFSTPLTSEDTGELVFERLNGKLHFIPETEKFGIQILRHDFDVKFAPAQKEAQIVDKMSLQSDVSGQEFFFRMSPQYLVTEITDGRGKPVPFSEAGGVVSTISPPSRDTYSIRYKAVVDLPNYAGSISQKEATLTNDYWYPMVGRQPVPFDLTVHSPRDWTTVGQGNLVSEVVEESEKITKYRMDMPCVFYSLSSAPYKKYRQEINGKWYSCWSTQLSPTEMEIQTEYYAPIIEYYETFAPFPFKGYGALDSEVYGGGALEAYSFTTWGHGSLPAEDSHEPAHTWWGGLINNSYLGSFWNESFAVFSEGLFRRNVPIGNKKERQTAFVSDMEANPAYNSASIARSGADIGGVASSLGYGKGSQVLQMLEQFIGTDRIIQAMRDWIKEYRGKLSDWADFEQIVTRENPDADLKSFFDDWTRKAGYADFSIDRPKMANGQLTFQLKFKGESYRVPLEVLVESELGDRKITLLDVRNSGTFTVPVTGNPKLVSIDPWRRILRKFEADETPIEVNGLLHTFKRVSDSSHRDYLRGLGDTGNSDLDSGLDGKFLVGHPDTMPALKPLCEKVGFKVEGNYLTYDGTRIDLTKGTAIAVVDLGKGAKCVIGLGRSRMLPNPGRARLALCDDLGRFLRGVTDPKTTGNLTFHY